MELNEKLDGERDEKSDSIDTGLGSGLGVVFVGVLVAIFRVFRTTLFASMWQSIRTEKIQDQGLNEAMGLHNLGYGEELDESGKPPSV